MSRARLQKLIAGGCVSLDDNIVADKDFKVRSGDSFAVFVPPAEEAEPAAENIPLDVVFEDDDLIVVNKPAGMTVHRRRAYITERWSMRCFITAAIIFPASAG